ncbi:hypothetical protein GCM10027586_21280 [Kineococcus gypseus]
MPAAVRSVIDALQEHWRALGVPRVLREPVAREVGADLHAAYLDGRTPEAVLGVAVDVFAEQVAGENGWLVPWPMYGRLLGAAAIGAVGAIAAGLVVVLPAMAGVLWAVGQVFVRVAAPGAVYGESTLYAVIVCMVYALFGVGLIAAVLAAVRRGLTAAQQLRRTLRAGALLLPLSAALSLPSAVAVGRASGYSTAPAVVLVEAALVLGLAAVALLTARAWALRVP